MHLRWIPLTSALLLALMPLAAQNARRGFSPPPPSEELAKQPQTKGAVGDQDRH